MMAQLAADAHALKLHTGLDGTVWFADGERIPISSGSNVAEFVKTLAPRQDPFVRILGVRQNALLLTSVYPHCLRGGVLEVGSPMACRDRAERSDPEIALYRMRQWYVTPSLGGWHAVSALDYPSYAMVAQFEKTNGFTQHVNELLQAHPAWKYLTFIEGISSEWAACLLSLIVDPRWFIDPDHPSRLSRLQSFLGLSPPIQQAAASSTGSPEVRRCRVVLNTWKSGGEPSNSDMEKPRNFLWRIWRHAGGGVRGDLQASKKLIVFLRHTWLMSLYTDTQYGGGLSGLFDPRMFFKNESELSAYSAHLSSS